MVNKDVYYDAELRTRDLLAIAVSCLHMLLLFSITILTVCTTFPRDEAL